MFTISEQLFRATYGDFDGDGLVDVEILDFKAWFNPDDSLIGIKVEIVG